ncbi:hypothetical protein HGM15179_010947 [Zosterops borbonicus]|uniref:Uncharacterized protein n=1 Tax=Zosterops borbonicus TaxID=364589 RepID=A0A8K1LJ92_9PASS|nr:hypothetical protein HGM15179_010947 [Zosterops borbonicus]
MAVRKLLLNVFGNGEAGPEDSERDRHNKPPCDPQSLCAVMKAESKEYEKLEASQCARYSVVNKLSFINLKFAFAFITLSSVNLLFFQAKITSLSEIWIQRYNSFMWYLKSRAGREISSEEP